MNPYSSVLCAPSSTLSHLKNLFCHFVSNPLVHAVVEMSCILVLLLLLDVGLRFVIFTSQAEQSDESEFLLVRGDTAVSQLGI